MAHAHAARRTIPHVLILSAFSCNNVAVEQAPDAFQYDDVRPTLTLTDEFGQVQVTEQDSTPDYVEYSGTFVSAGTGVSVAVEYHFPTVAGGWRVESETLEDGWELQHVYDPDGQPVSDVYVQQVDDVASGYLSNLESGMTAWFDWTNVRMLDAADDGQASRGRAADNNYSYDSTTNTLTIVFTPPTNCVPAGVDFWAWIAEGTNTCDISCNINTGNTVSGASATNDTNAVITIQIDPDDCSIDCPKCYER